MSSFRQQFRRPTGLAGAFVGHLMALKNRRRGRWVTSLLALRPGEHVLEIGFGPGADARRVLAAIGAQGKLIGVDASSVMVRQAARRNRDAVAAGRARFVVGDIDAGLPVGDAECDVVFSINCAQFWSDLERGFRELTRVLKPGGRLVVAVQPMHRGATRADSTHWVEALERAAHAAGLTGVVALMGPTRPPVAAVRAQRAI